MKPAVASYTTNPPALMRLVPALIPLVRDTLLSTCAVRILNPRVREEWLESKRPFVGVLWHQYFLMMLEFVGKRKIAILSSRSKDGEYTTRVMRRLGHSVVRGSSSAGGPEALRELVRVLRRGVPVILTPDGPRGPARVCKVGSVLAARLAGVPIVPLACSISSAHYFASWDRTAFPLPFARITLAYGEPIHVPSDADGTACEDACRRVEAAMAALERRCQC